MELLKPSFNLSLPYDNADQYLELESGRFFTRVSAILSTKSDDKTIRKYHAKSVGEEGSPDYARAAFLTQFSQLFGTCWHAAQQREIDLTGTCDLIPTDAYNILSEVQVLHWDLAYAGTFDLLFHDPTRGWVLRDFKTHSRFKSLTQEYEDVGIWDIDRTVQSSKKTKWRTQLAAYAAAIESCLQIKVDEAEILCFNVHTWKTSIELTMNQKQLEKSMNRFLDLRTHYLDNNF